MIFDFWRVTPKKRSVVLRKSKGVLFSNPSGWRKILFYIGVWTTVFGLFGLVSFYVPMIRAYVSFYINFKSKTTAIQEEISIKQDNEIQSQISKSIQNFIITIPKIGARADIVENVSPFDNLAYEKVLSQGRVAQSSTSSLPGEGKGKSVYLFAHSSGENILYTRANAVFYLLGELDKGDSVWVERNGTKFLYKVYDKKIVKASDTSYLNYSDKNRQVLILQTCWPIGTNWQRLMVLAELMAY